MDKKRREFLKVAGISTIAGIALVPNMGAYCATKAAMHSYTIALRQQLKQHGVEHIATLCGHGLDPIDGRRVACHMVK